MKIIEGWVKQMGLKSEYLIYCLDEKYQISLTSEKPYDIINDVNILNESNMFEKPIEIRSAFMLKGTGATFSGGINLSNCIFKEEFVLTNFYFNREVTINDSVFHKDVDLSDSKFDKNVRFHRTVFHEKVNCINTSFNSLVDFFFAVFEKDQQFYLTDFNSITIFSNTRFYGATQFLHNKVSNNTYVSFENSEFFNGIDLSRSNFLCKMKFFGIKIHNLNFVRICTNLLYMYDNDAFTNKQTKITTAKKIRESLRIIKQAFRSEDNNIEALNFHSMELACYKFEIGLSKNTLSERFLLCLNSISSSHGTSWIKGLIFTLMVTFSFYTIYLIALAPQLSLDLSLSGVGNFFCYFVQLLNVTNWKYIPFGIDTAPWGDILLFTSRIFISYGYYQLIQSFRKYTKN